MCVANRDRGWFSECTLLQLGHAKWVNIRRARYQDGTVLSVILPGDG